MHRLLAVIACATAGCTSTADSPDEPRNEGAVPVRVLIGTRVYVSPDTPPIDEGVVIVQGDKIAAVAPAANVRLRGDMLTSGCSGGVITAGFQNSHMHFTELAWQDAAGQPADKLARQLERMLTRFGFTSVVDIGSDVENTAALSRRVDTGEVRGPRIITTGVSLYPVDGIPFYIQDLPPATLARLPQPATSAEAVEVVRNNFAHGAVATKIFIATPQRGGAVKRMSADIARAVVAETHARGGLVVAHPTDVEGVRAAIGAGVDLLAHTTIDPPKATWDQALIRDLVARKVGVTPTLKLWGYELAKTTLPENIRQRAIGDAVEEIRAFAAAGGQVLFGTDVGYMADYDPTEEYVLLARAGLTPMQVLASLTTAPAARWKESERRGRVAPGLDADLVVLNGDPAVDVRNFANVRCAFRAGQEIFAQADGGS